MSEKYMKESDVYRSFIDYWDKGKTFGECLDAVPKYEINKTGEKKTMIDTSEKTSFMTLEEIDQEFDETMERLVRLGLIETRGNDGDGNTLYAATELGIRTMGPLFAGGAGR